MTRKPESAHAELPLGSPSRPRMLESFPASRIFPGWGPGLGR